MLKEDNERKEREKHEAEAREAICQRIRERDRERAEANRYTVDGELYEVVDGVLQQVTNKPPPRP